MVYEITTKFEIKAKKQIIIIFYKFFNTHTPPLPVLFTIDIKLYYQTPTFLVNNIAVLANMCFIK